MAGAPLRRARRREEAKALALEMLAKGEVTTDGVAIEGELQQAPRKECTPRLFQAILDDVSAGTNVKAAIRKHGVTDYSFYKFKDWDPENAKAYDTARLAMIEALADAGFEIAESNTIFPDDKRVQIDWLKWFLSKVKPERYGEKQAVDLRLQGSLSISIDTSPPPQG